MITKERCAVAVLASAFIDSSTQEGQNVLYDILDSLSITFYEYKEYFSQLRKNGKTRFEVYNEIRTLSSDEKGTVRNIIFKAYSQGGRLGTDDAVFYFKEMIDECDLANARIQL